MTDSSTELWDLLYKPTIDSDDLIEAAVLPDLDDSTLQLIHEAEIALESTSALDSVRDRIAAHKENLGFDDREVKFPRLKERIVVDLRREQIEQFSRELGSRLSQPAAITIGGSVALTLQGFPRKPADAIDLPDEIPLAIRQAPVLTGELALHYGIHIATFQSHFLPDAWETRTHSIPAAGHLPLWLVDAYDIMASTIYSGRTRDRQHLRRLAPFTDKGKLRGRLQGFTQRSGETKRSVSMPSRTGTSCLETTSTSVEAVWSGFAGSCKNRSKVA